MTSSRISSTNPTNASFLLTSHTLARAVANLLWLAPLIAMAVLTALATSFAVAGLTPNPQTAANIGATISFLLFAFTGAILPVQALPGALPHIVPYAVPHTALIEAIRGIALTGAPIIGYGRQVLIGAAWLALALVVAGLAYRFTEDSSTALRRIRRRSTRASRHRS